MSELVLPQRNRAAKWHLLATASGLALLANMALAPAVVADEDNHFYFEFGGQYGMQAGGSTAWFLPFAAPGGDGEDEESSVERAPSTTGPGGAVLPIGPRHSWDFDGSVKVQPADSDLIFSLGVKFGRTAQRSAGASVSRATAYGTGYYAGLARHRESHLNVDFQVGKDFGLGMFGHDGTSVFSAGLRYAHFTALTNTGFSTSTKYFQGTGATRLQRSFAGIGPMISWDASAPVSDSESGVISLDWGANAAVLFGKQRANLLLAYDTGTILGTGRNRSVTVPELGGFAGLSWHPAESGMKVSFGYRVDAAFDVLDAGLYQRFQVDRVEHGPFLKFGLQTN